MTDFIYFDGLYEIRAFPNQPPFTVLLENAPDGKIVLSDRAGQKLEVRADEVHKFEPQFVRKYDGPEAWDYFFLPQGRSNEKAKTCRR